MKELFYSEIKISSNNAWFVVIDKDVKPKVVYTDLSTQEYAQRNKNKVIINAGLFNTRTLEPNGQLIIDNKSINGDIIVESDMGNYIGINQCYPLIINDGNMFVVSDNRLSLTNISKNLEKYNFAVCGWGLLIQDGIDFELYEKEKRWGKECKARQIIGYLDNGCGFCLTCKNAYYKDIVKFLLNNRAKFAYSLDGGRSTKLVIDGEQINKFWFGYKGRKYIPTLIEWNLDI